MKMLMIFAVALVTLTGCMTTMQTEASATEAAICDAWGGALPTRSRSDTQTTIDQITGLYATFAAVCPDHEGLMP